jgi:hypothetical protein
LGISHEMRYVLKSRLSRTVARRARMPTSSGAKPEPSWPPPVKGENEAPTPAGGARGGAGSGVPSEGSSSWVPVAEGSVRLPVRVPKTSAVALATLAAALWTVPTALAAVVPTLDGRRNAPPTEAGMVGTGVEGVKPVTAVGLTGVRGGSPWLHGTAGSATRPLTSPASPEAAGSTCSEAAAGPGTGTSTGSGAGPDAYPSPAAAAAAAGAAGAGAGSVTPGVTSGLTSGESFGIGLGASTRPKSDAE